MVLLTAWMAMALHLMLKQSVAMVAKDLVVELPLPIGLALPLMNQTTVVVVAAAVAAVIEAEAQALVAKCSWHISKLNTSSTPSFTDVLEAGASRWYRVFAINADGTSIGSNVIRVDNPET